MSLRNSDGMLMTPATLAATAADNAVVHRADAETVSRTKTFGASRVAPAPTAGAHATTNSHVDVAVADGGMPGSAPRVKDKHQPARALRVTGCAPTVPAMRIQRW